METENPTPAVEAEVETADQERATVTKTHKPQLSQLRPIHREAIRRLLEGQTVTKAARDLGLSRVYLDDLKHNDPVFKEALEHGLVNKDDDILKRIQLTSYEALDVVRDIMRFGKTENTRLAAATTILDRAGYSKLEKRVSVIADAETIIRELNRRKGATGKQLEQGYNVAVEIVDGVTGQES